MTWQDRAARACAYFRVGALVEQAGPAGLLPVEVLVLRRHRDRFVRDRVERSVGVCAELDLLDHGGPVAEPIHLLPGQHETHRALQCARRQRGQNHLILRTQPGAESAAHERRHDAHVVRLHAEHAADVALNVLHALGLVVDRQLAVALEDHRRGVQLHRIVVLDRHIIFAAVAHLGRGERLFSCAARLWRGKRVIGRVSGIPTRRPHHAGDACR